MDESSTKRSRGRPRKPPRENIPDFDDTVGWFFRVLGLLTHELAVTRDRELRQDLRAVASAGLAAKNLNDQLKAERELKRLSGVVDEIMAARRHGTRSPGADQGAGCADQPGIPAH